MFQPETTKLESVLSLLEQGKIADNTQQKHVYQKIEEFSRSQEFYNYLGYILASKHLNISVRHMAGVTLKSLVERNFEHLPQESLDFVKSALFSTFEDSSSAVCNTVSTLITMIVYKGGFQKWPGLLEFLSEKLQSSDKSAVQNAIECLAKIIEDLRVNSENYAFLDSSKGGSQLNSLISRLFVFCEPSPSTKLQLVALRTLNTCVHPMPGALAEQIDLYLSLLLKNAVSSEKDIRQCAFQGILALTETNRKVIMARHGQIIEAVIQGISDPEYVVAKSACNFWLEYLTEDQEDDQQYHLTMNTLKPYLHKLLPGILKGLKFTNEDLMNILPSTQNISNRSDIGSELEFMEESGLDDDEGNNNSNSDNQIELDNESDSKDGNFHSDQGEYTLRKICGRSLEKLSRYFRDEVYLICQPLIDECFFSQDWKIQEIGIICLGDIAEGSRTGVQSHLSSIVPMLLQKFEENASHYLLRSSILWTICQYTNWLVENSTSLNEIIKKYLQCLVKGITQEKQYLQESACHCLKEFADQGSMILKPYLTDFIQVIVVAIGVYQGVSLSMMLDAVCTLIDTMKEEVNRPEILSSLIPPILQKWNGLKSSDMSIRPIAECLSQIAQETETNFQPYIEAVFPKCSEMMNNYIVAIQTDSKDRKHIFQKKQLFLISVDLMSSIVFCAKDKFSLLPGSQEIHAVLQHTVDSQDSEVRSFVFSLLAELAHNCPLFLQDTLLQYCSIISTNIVIFPSNLDPGNTYMNTCNNAIMCLNQFCQSFPGIMQSYAYEIALKIISILENFKQANKIFARNLCVALGSIALLDLQRISLHLESFIKKFCLCLRQYPSDKQDKRTAFEGLFRMCFTNPSGVLKNMSYVVDAFMNYSNPPENLKALFKSLLNEFQRSLSPEEWQFFLNNSGFQQIVIKNILALYPASQ